MPHVGLWLPAAAKGQRICADQLLGTIDDTPVNAGRDGLMLSLKPAAFIVPDDLYVGAYICDEHV